MTADRWVRPAAVMTLGPDGAAVLVTAAVDRLAARAARLDPSDDARLLAAGIEERAKAAVPHLLALPSIARPSAQRLAASVGDAENLLAQYAALAASGALDGAPVGQELTHRQVLVAALVHLSRDVAGMTEQLATIQASEARVAAARALDRDLEWTPRPDPEPAEPVLRAPEHDGIGLVVGAFAVLAVLVLILLGRLAGGDGSAHTLAPTTQTTSTIWSQQ
jgi:hypothetical protein